MDLNTINEGNLSFNCPVKSLVAVGGNEPVIKGTSYAC